MNTPQPVTRRRIELGLALERLAYHASDGRDLRLDFLRGLAVLAMIVDHLGGWSPLHVLTGGNHFFTSAAEGFVFLSGLVTGLVYGRLADRGGLPDALSRLLQRAGTLYVLAVSLTFISLRTNGSGDDLDPLPLLWSVVSLHRTGYLVDVPLLYTLLLLGAQFALLLLHQGRTGLLLLFSWLAWLGYQVFPEQSGLPWSISNNNLFQLAPWQVLFFTGMVVGYHRDRVRWALPSSAQWLLLLLASLGMLGLLLVFSSDQAFALDVQERLFSKSDVRVGRLLASTIVFSFAFLLTTRLWVPIQRGLGWLLLPLGQHALYAYTAHVVLALGLLAALGTTTQVIDTSPALSAVLQAAGVSLIWGAVRLRLLFPTRATRRWWSLAPVPLALLSAVLAHPAPAVARATADSRDSGDQRLARLFGTPVTQLPQAQPVATPAAVPTSSPAIATSLREVSFWSPTLSRQMSYYVWLPSDYDASQQRYPVLVMLHGGGGSKDEWPAYGLVTAVDQLVACHEIRPLIVIMPQGDKGYWVNQAQHGPRWGDYVVQDVLGSVDSTFRTLPDADHRAIGGLSMGAAGALQLAFNHPNVFHVVGAHSPSLHLDDGTFPVLGTGAEFDGREPIRLAALAPGLEGLTIWIDAGEQDPWLGRNQLLHQALVDRGVAHQWHVLPGGHEGPYWQINLERYLRFYGASLNRPRME